MRYLALDWGTVRIGVAVSDPDGKIAFPLSEFIESKNAIKHIKEIIREQQIEKVLVGLPQGMASQATESTIKVKEFIIELQKEISSPVEEVDERLTSVQAGKLLQEQGLSQIEQREMKDNIAAQIILQQYLDTKNK